jgi:hypothetical protein
MARANIAVRTRNSLALYPQDQTLHH